VKKSAALRALSEWVHVNCLKPVALEQIKDGILRSLISRTFHFEMDEDELATKQLNVEDLNGGHMTYLFERETSSKMDLP
jgi:hypothetical protein